MTIRGRFSWSRAGIVTLVAVAVAIAFSPAGISFSAGITTEDPGFDPAQGGCTASGCHGGEAFSDAASAGQIISVAFEDEEGGPLGGPYEHGAVYTITISLDEQNAPDADNHAGFNFFIDGGSLEAVDDKARVTAAGDEATHADASSAEWQLRWTAPDSGAVTWRLYVNDVDGNGAPNPADQVYLTGGWLTDADSEFAMPGAVAGEEEAHVGVPLPQYWLGLIALAGMLFIMLWGFVYLKYVNPHNADQKDR